VGPALGAEPLAAPLHVDEDSCHNISVGGVLLPQPTHSPMSMAAAAAGQEDEAASDDAAAAAEATAAEAAEDAAAAAAYEEAAAEAEGEAEEEGEGEEVDALTTRSMTPAADAGEAKQDFAAAASAPAAAAAAPAHVAAATVALTDGAFESEEEGEEEDGEIDSNASVWSAGVALVHFSHPSETCFVTVTLKPPASVYHKMCLR